MDSRDIDHNVLEEKLHDVTELPISLPFDFLKDITCNFSNEQELGKGGFGIVYKGVLRSGKIIAVKKLIGMHLMDDDKFQKEVTNVMGIKHENIVPLVGYCAESTWEAIKHLNGNNIMAQIPKRLLCFEYLPNKSLEVHVSDESCGLDWNQRYEINKGICSGLHFLHQECHILHLDLKPENILMDATMMPKIADFCLSKLLGAQKSQTIIHGSLAGSLGYMAPEYWLQGVVSPMADVFSFGVIIIEIVTGQRDYPLSTMPSFQQFHANDSGRNPENSFKQYTQNVLGQWTNVFEKESKQTSQEIYTEQVKQCISIALKCVDPDSWRRPNVCEIFEMLTGEICSCQKMKLLSAQAFELCFNFKAPHVLSFASLQLTNNTNAAVAFWVVKNDRDKQYFIRRLYCGLVLPRSTYTLRVGMHRPSEDYSRFTSKLQCAIVGDQYERQPVVEASGCVNDYNRFFTEASNEGREIQHVKLKCVITHEEGNVIVPDLSTASWVANIFVHPTKTWIITELLGDNNLRIWDYQKQEKVHPSKFFHLAVGVAMFIPREQWFVVGCNNGYIQVYNYETMQEVKTFRAHDRCIVSLDIHPSEPYVLSASERDGMVKLWNWENGWDCIRTFDTVAREAKFNPKDADYFACATKNGVKIWNIVSPGRGDLTFGSSTVRLHYLTHGDELCLITGDICGLVKIWDWKSRICLQILQGHTEAVTTVCVHPNLPIVITGSFDGTVLLWNTSTFELEGKLKCGLGEVYAVACFKGSKRIAIGHRRGLAITEI